MEKGEAQRLGVDRWLAKWALDEAIIERKENGEYKLCAQNGSNGANAERESIADNINSSFVSDVAKEEENDPHSIIVATTSPIQDRMQVDD